MKRSRTNKFFRFLIYLLIFLLVIIGGIAVWYYFDTQITPPKVNEAEAQNLKRKTIGDNYYTVGKNWLRKNKYGIWEMYLEGAPFEMGVANGILSKELIYKQEEAFIDQIKLMVPSESYLDFLKYFTKFFNRDIDEYILPEYLKEIYGVSYSASDDFNFIGTKYERLLNYHAAHDIGHTLQNLMLVGCTSFAANMGFSDSSLIIGRNFDFYINDAFAEDKIVCFVNPDRGYQFAYVTWASMIGVVSGMNKEGITVTINAGSSDIPFKSATPISLLAREILQYASNIGEAIDIAKKRKTFVSESLLIGSAADNQAIIIEKSPSKLGVYESSDNYLVCANHFQSNTFSNDKSNKKQILESASSYRQNRAKELLFAEDTLNYLGAASVLRDKNGLNNRNIGIGNEKAMAQMISHHSVIFKPEKMEMWVSTSPYQLGEFIAYKLTNVLQNSSVPLKLPVYDSTLTIPADPFLFNDQFEDFNKYKLDRNKIKEATKIRANLNIGFIENFIKNNPEYYQGYVIVGDYYASIDNNKKALQFYRFSLKKVFERSEQRRDVEQKIKKLSDQ